MVNVLSEEWFEQVEELLAKRKSREETIHIRYVRELASSLQLTEMVNEQIANRYSKDGIDALSPDELQVIYKYLLNYCESLTRAKRG